MKKLIFSILPAFLFAFISCMNMSSGSGENGSVRVVLPGSGRATYSYDKNNADKFIVRLYNDDFDQTEEGAVGGVIEFGDLEPGKYTATAEAWNLGENILEGSGSTEITVRAGETTDCNITMILEGQTAYYSKYLALANFNIDIKCNITLYDYSNLNTVINSFEGNFVSFSEDKNSNLYYILYSSGNGYRCIKKTQPSSAEIADSSSSTSNYSYYRDLYYEPTTDTLYRIGDDNSQVGVFELSCIKNVSKQSDLNFSSLGTIKVNNSDAGSVKCFAVKDDKVYMVYNYYNYATTKYDISVVSIDDFSNNNNKTIEHSGKSFNLSGEVTDMAVLEDGTVAVLVNEKSLNPANQFTLNDGCTVYSRGALVLLSSDLSKVEKVIGWTDSQRTISATNVENAENYVTKWTSITAYIPDYAERNSHFYGPMRIVAIRPKELVIADCGANFVLADYKKHRQGKMFTHNRLMTVNLRNFAIGCKKEFSEDELKFQNLSISGNIAVTTSGDWSNKYVDEK